MASPSRILVFLRCFFITPASAFSLNSVHANSALGIRKFLQAGEQLRTGSSLLRNMLRNALGLADAGQQRIGDSLSTGLSIGLPISIGLDAHLAGRVMRELQLAGDERVLLLGAGTVLEKAMARAVSASRCQLAESPLAGSSPAGSLPDLALGNFDLSFLNLATEQIADASATICAAAESLRPGGRLVLIAQDLYSLSLWPRIEGFQALWHSYLACQGQKVVGLADLETQIQTAGLRSMASTTLSCSDGQERGSSCSLGDRLITALCGAREQILTHAGMKLESFAACLLAMQVWRESSSSSVSLDAFYAVGRRRMRDYLTLLPGAELACCGS